MCSGVSKAVHRPVLEYTIGALKSPREKTDIYDDNVININTRIHIIPYYYYYYYYRYIQPRRTQIGIRLQRLVQWTRIKYYTLYISDL